MLERSNYLLLVRVPMIQMKELVRNLEMPKAFLAAFFRGPNFYNLAKFWRLEELIAKKPIEH